jgi:hypothetical protein
MMNIRNFRNHVGLIGLCLAMALAMAGCAAPGTRTKKRPFSKIICYS